jgi:MFS family permease
MVRDFNIAKSDKDIGFYAGFLGSAFMVGRFLTSVQWGMAADKYGRKPIMCIGVISVIIFHTMFGVSTTFWMALISRFLLGTFNGMSGTVKAYASEICSEKHQAISVSIVGTVWGLGLIIGPAMGGYFSQPAIKYPNLFPPGSLFDRYAYLLPSLLVVVVAFPTLYVTFYLPVSCHYLCILLQILFEARDGYS